MCIISLLHPHSQRAALHCHTKIDKCHLVAFLSRVWHLRALHGQTENKLWLSVILCSIATDGL